MKVKIFCVLTSLLSLLVHSQKEANIWYFGENAGLDFNNDIPVALIDGQLNTYEGCATIADDNGNLIFYTDGITVWNKNHQVMSNGLGLMGDSSTTQSATIVQMPGSLNLYYVFTLAAEAGVNGFRYSVIDMNLDSSLGGVTIDKNVLLYAPSNEKLSIVRHANNNDYWVVTHGWNDNSFRSYLLTSSGLTTMPIISNVGFIVNGSPENTWGSMKISPDGSKLAISHALNSLELLNFDNQTGVVSDPITLFNNGGTYGVEFSPNSKVLYASVTNSSPYKIIQYDLTAINISGSTLEFYNSQIIPGGLQLGPDNKIYIAEVGKSKLGVIENPNIVGVGCNLILDAVDLAGRICNLGLPPFVSSFFFVPAIQLENACVGQNTTFEFNASQQITSAVWNFGDGGTSTTLSPTHVYSAPGTYTVSATVTGTNGVGTNTREIIIHMLPVLNTNTVNLKQCDDDNDGFSAFNLNQVILLLVNDTTGLAFSFHETLQAAKDNTSAITNDTSYINESVSNDVVFIRVQNANGCYQTAQINLHVSTTLIPPTFQKVFIECDDVASGSNIDGVATFDFSSVTAEVKALYPAGQLLDITYYKNVADALAENNAITDIANYSNIGYPTVQDIYVRVDSRVNNECLGLGHHITLKVEAIPIVQPVTIHHCDDDQDGIYGFDTANLEATLLDGLTNATVSYTDENNNPLPTPLPNPFTTHSQTIIASVTNTTPMACSFATTIDFVVDDLPEIFPIPTNLTTVCDDETDPALQDGIFAFDTSAFQSTVLGNQTGMIVDYFDENGNPLSSPLPNPFVSGTQDLTVQITNPANTSCVATSIVPLIVNPIPDINLLGNELICNDNPDFTKTINAGVADVSTINDFTYKWFFNGTEIPSETDYSLVVNTEGIYEAEVQNTYGCTTTRTITVTSSNVATIESIEVVDLSDNNTITILVSGLGDYVYSLDNETFQESNTFSNLDSGIYTVYVKDLNRCGTKSKDVSVLGIPRFFTPNGDGYNDYWNIKGFNLNLNSKAVITVFDRYGKLLKQFYPSSSGWDGTHNGSLMPSTDYWFTVQLEDGRNIRGHFTLKR